MSTQPDFPLTQHSTHKWRITLTHFEPSHIIFLRTHNLHDEKRHKFRRYLRCFPALELAGVGQSSCTAPCFAAAGVVEASLPPPWRRLAGGGFTASFLEEACRRGLHCRLLGGGLLVEASLPPSWRRLVGGGFTAAFLEEAWNKVFFPNDLSTQGGSLIPIPKTLQHPRAIWGLNGIFVVRTY